MHYYKSFQKNFLAMAGLNFHFSFESIDFDESKAEQLLDMLARKWEEWKQKYSNQEIKERLKSVLTVAFLVVECKMYRPKKKKLNNDSSLSPPPQVDVLDTVSKYLSYEQYL